MKVFLIIIPLLWATGCVTKGELRREQEIEKLRQDVKDIQGSKVDLDVVSDDLKGEIEKTNSQLGEQIQWSRTQSEELRKQVATLTDRVTQLEQRNREQAELAQKEAEKPKATYEMAKSQYDAGQFEEAAETLRAVLKNVPPRSEEAKKAQFLLADSFFASKEYATAALEFSDFKKNYPKDGWIPMATYRQANCFRAMGKMKEARLFYQELLDKFPKSSLVAKAKKEMKLK